MRMKSYCKILHCKNKNIAEWHTSIVRKISFVWTNFISEIHMHGIHLQLSNGSNDEWYSFLVCGNSQTKNDEYCLMEVTQKYKFSFGSVWNFTINLMQGI